jgi:hypothetical protein
MFCSADLFGATRHPSRHNREKEREEEEREEMVMQCFKALVVCTSPPPRLATPHGGEQQCLCAHTSPRPPITAKDPVDEGTLALGSRIAGNVPARDAFPVSPSKACPT